MICNKCGREIADDSSFCEYCGAEITRSENGEDAVPVKEKKSHAKIIIIAVVVLLIAAAAGLIFWQMRDSGADDGDTSATEEASVTENAGSGNDTYSDVRQSLTDEYGECEKVISDQMFEFENVDIEDYEGSGEDNYVYYMSPGIMEFCEIDMDKDGSDELLCMRQTEEMGFDCMVYDETDSGVEMIYSLAEDDEVIPERYGGIAVRDGDIPHFVYLNRMTAMCLYYMENGEIVKRDLGEEYEDSDLYSYELYGYADEDYNDFIGMEENYDELMLIYGELKLKREIE